ncbi:MAG: NADH-quinone oxidoreductase subunit C [Halobacteriovoraceae bacterium]|nr:NADH-quinone oxidoreductase subunit C [Halobacteriovoraceae bacterium]MCB9093836.1 NADH-quinone oxidoreductase subunit C [Halobacteriovoraceae bacterium]
MLSELSSLINSKVPNAKAEVINPEEGSLGEGSILVAPESIYAVCEFLKTNDKYSFNALQVISGVDYLECIEVNYMLGNFDVNNPRQLILKTKLTDRVNPRLDSVCGLWHAANYQERECYDMLGVTFNNHPDHRRILCPDDWEGFPLRKDYMTQKYYRDMEVFPDDKMNYEEREFIVRQKQMEEDLKKRMLERGM